MMELNRKFPRSLEHTLIEYEEDLDGNMVWGHPLDIAEDLINNQGNNKKNWKDTCGICCIANVLRLAGVNSTEQEVLDYYRKSLAVLSVRLRGGTKGATNSESRQAILKHYGIESILVLSLCNKENKAKDEAEVINEIAEYVEQGKGVIISVNSSDYDKSRCTSNDVNHALLVTGVVKSCEGTIVGFFIHDSRGKTKAEKYKNRPQKEGTLLLYAHELFMCLSPEDINVTKSIIR